MLRVAEIYSIVSCEKVIWKELDVCNNDVFDHLANLEGGYPLLAFRKKLPF